MISDTEARDILVSAWASLNQDPMTDSQLHMAMCVARHESGYGCAWCGVMTGSNNWGAIQAGSMPRKGYSRLYQDTHPNPDGTNTTYKICFREYATPVEGAADLLRVLYLKRIFVFYAAETGNVQSVAQEMHKSGYFEGSGATVAIRISNYAKALWRNYSTILKSTGWESKLLLNA